MTRGAATGTDTVNADCTGSLTQSGGTHTLTRFVLLKFAESNAGLPSLVNTRDSKRKPNEKVDERGNVVVSTCQTGYLPVIRIT